MTIQERFDFIRPMLQEYFSYEFDRGCEDFENEVTANEVGLAYTEGEYTGCMIQTSFNLETLQLVYYIDGGIISTIDFTEDTLYKLDSYLWWEDLVSPQYNYEYEHREEIYENA